jgi:hypothetical protein
VYFDIFTHTPLLPPLLQISGFKRSHGVNVEASVYNPLKWVVIHFVYGHFYTFWVKSPPFIFFMKLMTEIG